MADYPRNVLITDAQGVYIPQEFATNSEIDDGSCKRNTWRGIDAEDLAILEAGPDHEHYREAWDSVLDNAHLFDDNGTEWHLEQDGDLFAIVADAGKV
jgi:hypothetical protein